MCGNNKAEGKEQCDGADHRMLTCEHIGFGGGQLVCNEDCTFDTNLCFGEGPVCGDGRATGLEECDGTDLKFLECAHFKFESGKLRCSQDCKLDTSECVGKGTVCGDGKIDFGEECDSMDLGDMECDQGGELKCKSDCTIDYSECGETELTECGNGIADPNEECDGRDLNDMTCKKKGFAKGSLSCTTECTFDTSDCKIKEAGFEPVWDWDMDPAPPTDVDYSYDELKGKSAGEIKDLGDEFKILAFKYYNADEQKDYYFPFPRHQFELDERTYNEHPAIAGQGGCANAHYNAPKALDIYLNWITEPYSVCGWGSEDYVLGTLAVSPQHVINWMNVFGSN
jgi:hypothetical protein